ncbi:capsule assembly Wzi family protein [Candidatus Neomarinimicrobiota bacterium]
MKINLRILLLTILISNLSSQVYFPADPLLRLTYEINEFQNYDVPKIPLLKPAFNLNDSSQFRIIINGEIGYNSGVANLENMSNRWFGKGWSFFRSINISGKGKFVSFSIEPFLFVNENLDYKEPNRPQRYTRLVDNRYHDQSPLVKLNLRETQLYLHYKGLGIGLSNANMWWGSGIQSSLLMTNNTVQFPYIVMGTINEQRIRNIGLNSQFFFSHLDNKNIGKPYFAALNLDITFYSDPILTVGLSRLFITPGRNISWKSALKQPFQAFYRSSLITEERPTGWSPDDQIIVGFLKAVFPEAKMMLFIEVGRGDHAADWEDLRRHPDHSLATIMGFRKVGLFDNEHLLLGFEYQNNVLPEKYWHLRNLSKESKISFQDKPSTDFNSYDGRHWAMHSGPDSDDLLLYAGYVTDSWSLIPMFNYERRGVIAAPSGIPEVKYELKLNFQYKFQNMIISSLLEVERFDNYSFNERKVSNLVLVMGFKMIL